MSVLSMRSIIILLVLLVNTIYCDNEKDGKGVSVSQPDNSGSAVIDGVTVPIEVASTVKGNATASHNNIAPQLLLSHKKVNEEQNLTISTADGTCDQHKATITCEINKPINTENDTGNETTTVEPTTTVLPNITTTIEPTTTTTTTTPKPNVTTTIKPTPVPPVTTTKSTTTSEMPVTTPYPAKNRHFDGASFIGGIILAVGLMGIGVIAFKYYKARTERNYHTL